MTSSIKSGRVWVCVRVKWNENKELYCVLHLFCVWTNTHTHVYRQSHTPFTHPPTWYEVKRKKSTSTFSHPMFCDVARDVLLALPQPLPLCCLAIIPTALHAGRALLTLARRHARLHCRMTKQQQKPAFSEGKRQTDVALISRNSDMQQLNKFN